MCFFQSLWLYEQRGFLIVGNRDKKFLETDRKFLRGIYERHISVRLEQLELRNSNKENGLIKLYWNTPF